MPTISLIEQYEKIYGSCEIRYFDSNTWLMPILTRIAGQDNASKISSKFDKIFNIKTSAFNL